MVIQLTDCVLQGGPPPQTEDSLPSSNRLLNLLAVEDDPADVLLLEFALKEVGPPCRITVVGDGEAAITHLLSHAPQVDARPDLILLDLNLPRMNGHEVLRFIRGDIIMQTIPVVVLTSSTDPQDVRLAYQNGANSYVTKPTSREEVLDMIRSLKRFWLHLAVLPSAL